MYSFTEQLELARQANPSHIPVYRAILESIHNPASTRIDSDEKALAVDLLYILLDTFTIEEIRVRCTPPQDLFREPAKKPQEGAKDILPAESPAAGENAAKAAETTTTAPTSDLAMELQNISAYYTISARIAP